MYKIKELVLGAFETHSYLLEVEGESGLILIDVGDTIEDVEVLSHLKCTILTHNHLDHIKGLSDDIFKVPVYMSSIDLNNLTEDYLDYSYNAYGYALFKSESEYENFKAFILLNKHRITPLNDGDKIEGLTVLLTSGHTKGSITLLDEKQKALFTGDTIFALGSIGRTDLRTGSELDMETSISKLSKYINNGYSILSGH